MHTSAKFAELVENILRTDCPLLCIPIKNFLLKIVDNRIFYVYVFMPETGSKYPGMLANSNFQVAVGD